MPLRLTQEEEEEDVGEIIVLAPTQLQLVGLQIYKSTIISTII